MKIKALFPVLFALLAVLGLLAAPLASAAPRVQGGVVNACLKTKGSKRTIGTLRVVASTKECKRKKGETALSWNLAGSSGTSGSGSEGSSGKTGEKGARGEAGAKGETGSAAVVDKKLEETITNQSKELEKLGGKVVSLSTEVLNLEQTLGTVQG